MPDQSNRRIDPGPPRVRIVSTESSSIDERNPLFPSLSIVPSSNTFFLGVDVVAVDDRRWGGGKGKTNDTSRARKINPSGQCQLDLDEQSANDVKVERPLR